MKYDEPKEMEWVQPIRRGYRLCCCDCGLVHDLDFTITGNKRKYILFRGKRNNRATAQVRRKLNG
jgi:hypothetical protein